METHFRDAYGRYPPLEALEKALRADMVSKLIRKNQIIRILELLSMLHFVFSLDPLCSLQHYEHGRSRRNNTLLIILEGIEEINILVPLFPLQLLINMNDLLLEVDTIPSEAQDLPFPHAGKHIHKEEILMRLAMDLFQELFQIMIL